MSTKDKVLVFSVILGLLYWVVDAVLNYYYLFYDGTLLGMLILDVPLNILYLRTFVFLMFVTSGVLFSKILGKQEQEQRINSVIYKIAYAVNITENLSELFKAIHNYLGKVVDVTNFYIALYDKDTDIISLPYFVDQRDKAEVFPAGKTLTAYVIKKGKPLFATREVIKRMEKSGEIEIIGPPAEVWVGVPLKTGAEIIGALAVLSYTNAHLYTEKDLNILKSVSGQVAIAIKRKQAAEAVQAREKEKAVILDSLSELVSYKDTEMRIVWANNAVLESIGLSSDELIGRHCYEVWEHRDEPRGGCPIVEVLKTGEFKEGEVTTSDGRRWLVRGNPVKDEDGVVVGVVDSSLNITERRRLEEQLIQAKKMETVGRLAGGIAHDFNNLLTAIRGYANLLIDGLSPEDSRYKDMKQILKASERATTLTDRLLAFSRRKFIKPQVIDLNELILGIDEMLRRLITEDIELIFIPTEDLSSVKVDPAQIEQVIVNLVVNARDAMPRGGKLFIETGNVALDEDFIREHIGSKPGDYVRMSVRDTGIGIPEELMEHIFEPFFTTKKEGRGTGLGLSTVYGIVKQHNGYISVESTPGRGTTVNVYLLQVEEKAERIPLKEMDETLPEGKETVLIVEDEEMVRGFAHRVLQSLGYTVLEASNGKEAVRVAEEHEDEIHLLLTDIVMPRMNGMEVAKYFQKIRPKIKVLFVSGYSDSITEQHGFLFKGMNFLQKPFASRELAQKLREVLDSE
jgi:PAS domain S-box-containing protein